jgi:hypothetical protein
MQEKMSNRQARLRDFNENHTIGLNRIGTPEKLIDRGDGETTALFPPHRDL